MDGVAQLDEIIPMLEEIVQRMSAGGLDAQTPCSEWTVRDVLAHMTQGAAQFTGAFRGEDPKPVPDGEPVQTWRTAVQGLLQAVHTPGSQERTIASPFGDVPGALFARFVALDGLLHASDLSAATGQPYAPREELVLAVDGFAREAVTEDMRAMGMFAPERVAAEGAGALERLLAFSGRQA